jgi:putative transposase
LQDVLSRLDKAVAAFFRRVKEGETPGYPGFKPSSRYDSFAYQQSGFRLAGNNLDLSKIGSYRIHLSRHIEGTIKPAQLSAKLTAGI